MSKAKKSSKPTAVKTPETGSDSATLNSVPMQDGVMQPMITDFIRNDETIMKAIIDTVSNALAKKLLGNKSFIDTLSLKLMENGVTDSVKQSIYEANAMLLIVPSSSRDETAVMVQVVNHLCHVSQSCCQPLCGR